MTQCQLTQCEQIACRLTQGRKFSESLLADFKTPEQWTHQVFPNANHALWFAGHMGVVDNFFVSLLDPAQDAPHEEFRRLFGTGSTPTSDPADYPPVADVLAYMRERRAVLEELLAGMTDDDLERATPEGTPELWPTYRSVLEMAIWHEALHAGQVTLARRSLGAKPVGDGQ